MLTDRVCLAIFVWRLFLGLPTQRRHLSVVRLSRHLLSDAEAKDVLKAFVKYHFECYLHERQQNDTEKRQDSIVAAIVHQNFGWIHIARYIAKHGLPKRKETTEEAAEQDDADFAKTMANWLGWFAWQLGKYQTSVFHSSPVLHCCAAILPITTIFFSHAVTS